MKKIVAIFLVVIMSITTFAKSQDYKEVEVTGLGQDEESAIMDAKRNAVRQGLGTFITTETVVENFMLKYDKIKSTAQGFVTDLKVISKEKTEDNLIKVTVDAKVTMDNILGNKQAMQILLESLNKPRIMVAIDETNSENKKVNSPTTETEIINMLVGKGFDVVDQNQSKLIRKSDQLKQLVAGNKGAVKVIASRFGAELLIVGSTEISAKKNKILGDMYSVQALINLRAINTNTGKIVYSSSVSSAYPHVDPLVGGQKAIKKALKKEFLNRFVVKVLDAFQNVQNNGVQLKISVTNIKEFKQFKAIKKYLNSLTKVQNLVKRSWNKSSGLCIFEARFLGKTGEEMGDYVDGKKIGNKKISVNDFSSNTIDLSVE